MIIKHLILSKLKTLHSKILECFGVYEAPCVGIANVEVPCFGTTIKGTYWLFETKHGKRIVRCDEQGGYLACLFTNSELYIKIQQWESGSVLPDINETYKGWRDSIKLIKKFCQKPIVVSIK